METVSVVVIGNGPSGILMSLLLSGYALYPANSNKFAAYLEKADKAIDRKLVLAEDLRKLSQGLKGRSENPVALLFDDCFHPGSDTGRVSLPTLDVRRPSDWSLESNDANLHSRHGFSHVVFGSGALGGSWNSMQSNLICLSPKNWMELPGLSINEWEKKIGETFNYLPSRDQVLKYYQGYVTELGLSQHFRNFTKVVNVSSYDPSSNGSEGKLDALWKIDYESVSCDGEAKKDIENVESPVNSNEQKPESKSLLAQYVVLANGMYDVPKRLGIVGESNAAFVSHRMSARELEGDIVVVGAGLSAADMICYHLFPQLSSTSSDSFSPKTPTNTNSTTKSGSCRILHLFRAQSTVDGKIGRFAGDYHSYPGYATLWDLMNGKKKHARYVPMIDYALVEISSDDGACYIEKNSNINTKNTQDNAHPDLPKEQCLVRREKCEKLSPVSHVFVLIGSRPDLSFIRDSDGKSFPSVDAKLAPIGFNQFTYETFMPGVYALGPLTGDNFLRFILGGPFAVMCDILVKERATK